MAAFVTTAATTLELDHIMLWAWCVQCNGKVKSSSLIGGCEALVAHGTSKGCITGVPHTCGSQTQNNAYVSAHKWTLYRDWSTLGDAEVEAWLALQPATYRPAIAPAPPDTSAPPRAPPLQRALPSHVFAWGAPEPPPSAPAAVKITPPPPPPPAAPDKITRSPPTTAPASVELVPVLDDSASPQMAEAAADLRDAEKDLRDAEMQLRHAMHRHQQATRALLQLVSPQ
jgi:hypothetical protein